MNSQKEPEISENTENIRKLCKYCDDGICILSDCKCLKTADGSVECSSFTEK